MITQKIFTGGKSEVAIVCQQCGAHKLVNMSSIKQYGKPFRVKCSCGFVFNVVFEPRGYYRKTTELFGVCYKSGCDEVISDITVRNISRTGVCFVLESKSSSMGCIKEGDMLKLQFTLNLTRRSLIRTNVIVRFIGDGIIGAEFYKPDDYTIKEIGFYLMP